MFNFSKDEKKRLVDLDKKIEAILFYSGEEVSLSFLVKILAVKKKTILENIDVIEKRLENSPTVLIKNGERFLLTLRKEYSDLISQIKGEEKLGELSGSALETLSIVLYKGPISKSEIDQIRGINSSYILRNLLIRGLVERKNIEGKTCYCETINLLRYLGVEDKELLPGFDNIIEKLNEIDKKDEDVFVKKEQ